MAAGEERRLQAVILSRIRRLQRRLNSELGLRAAVVPLWCAVTVAALHRLLLRDGAPIVALVAVGVAFAVWFRRMRRARLSETDAAVMLDRLAGAGGLLLTRIERPIGAWELSLNERVRGAAMPEVRRTRSVLLLMLAFVFGIAAFTIPLPQRAERTVNAAASSKVAEVEALAEALSEEVPLESAIQEELARLREELADGRFDAADWEAADHLEDALTKQAAERAAALSRAADAAAALENAVAAAQEGGVTVREREALERALMDLGEGNVGDGGAPGTGDPSRMSELQRALSERREQLEKAFGTGQGTGRQRMAQRGQGEGQGQSPGENGAEGGQRGRGGPSRGGGRGELRFDQPVDMDPDRLAFSPLPQGQGGEEPGELWGLRAADPKPSSEPSRGGSPGGDLTRGEQAPSFDQSAQLPRNRELVRRYFDTAPKR